MGFNLAGTTSTADIEQAGRRVPVLDRATGKPITDGTNVCHATVVGSYSERFKAAQKSAKAKEEALGESITDAQREQINREMWAECVLSWDLEIDGDPAVAQIFKLRPEIYDQMVKVATSHEGFFVEL